MFVSKPKSSSDDWLPRIPPEFTLHGVKTSLQAFPGEAKVLNANDFKAPYLAILGGVEAIEAKLGTLRTFIKLCSSA